MAVVQTEYTQFQRAAVNGMEGTMLGQENASYTAETPEGIPFGVVVGQGADARGCVLGAGADYLGVTVRDVTLTQAPKADPEVYGQYQNVAVKRRGDIWVKVGSDVAVGAAASFNAATGVIGSAGTAIPGSRFLTAAATEELALLQLTGQI
jgi:hypothetical protein